MRRKQRKQGAKSRIYNGSIIVALASALIVFWVLLQVEKQELSGYEKGYIYVARQELAKGQLITSDNYLQFLEQKELDKGCIPQTALCSETQIQNMIAAGKIEEGVLLTTGMFETPNEVTEGMRMPVIAGFKAEDMYQLVSGTLRTGDRINIYSVGEEGMELPVWRNVYVQQVFDASGAVISGDDTKSCAQRVNVYLESEEVNAFYSALDAGALRAVKVCE